MEFFAVITGSNHLFHVTKGLDHRSKVPGKYSPIYYARVVDLVTATTDGKCGQDDRIEMKGTFQFSYFDIDTKHFRSICDKEEDIEPEWLFLSYDQWLIFLCGLFNGKLDNLPVRQMSDDIKDLCAWIHDLEFACRRHMLASKKKETCKPFSSNYLQAATVVSQALYTNAATIDTVQKSTGLNIIPFVSLLLEGHMMFKSPHQPDFEILRRTSIQTCVLENYIRLLKKEEWNAVQILVDGQKKCLVPTKTVAEVKVTDHEAIANALIAEESAEKAKEAKRKQQKKEKRNRRKRSNTQTLSFQFSPMAPVFFPQCAENAEKGHSFSFC